jgi:PAS domain S-box-containing protein
MRTALPAKEYLIFSLAIITIAIIGYFYLNSTSDLIDTSRQAKANYQRINETQHLLYLIRHLESDMRGYTISGNKIFVGNYGGSKGVLLKQLKTIEQTFGKLNRSEIAELRELTKLKLEFTEEVINLLNKGQKQEAEAMVTKGTGKFLMSKIELQSEKIIKSIERQMSEQSNLFYYKSKQMYALILFGKVVTLAIFFAGIIKILFELKRRLHLERELQEKNNSLLEINQALEIKTEELKVANERNIQVSKNTIRKQELLFKTVINNIPSPIFLFNSNFQAIFRNDACLKKYKELNIDPNKPISESFRRQYSNFYDTLYEAKQGDKAIEKELTFVRAGGDRKTYVTRFVPIIEKGSLEYILVISHDISDRKKNEEDLLKLTIDLDDKVKERTRQLEQINEKLNKTTEELLDLYNNAPLGYFSLNANGQITKVNNTSLKLLGYEEDDLMGKYFRETILPEQLRGVFDTSFPNLRTGQKLENAEREFVKKNGALLPVLLNVTAVMDEEGKFVSTRSAFTDNTEMKKARRDAEKYVEALQLANSELEGFSYSISHDLRAPLRSINGFGQILKKEYYDVLDNEGRRFIDIILVSSSQMGAMIDELLEFARLGKKGMTKSKFSMTAVVEEVINQVTNFDTERIQKVFFIQELPLVCADKNLIKQVWQNLILNALKFSSRRDDQKIWISWEEDLNFFTFKIVDNGVGFDARYSSKLFGVFQRLHSIDEFEGTGAGLAIVKRIIQSHGGNVWAEGEIDKGATFYFSIPKNI